MLTPMNIRINMCVKRTNMPLPGWQAQCTHMPDMAITERWWRIFAADFGYALH